VDPWWRAWHASEHAHADAVIAANWSAPMKLFERSLDYGSQTLDVPMAFIEIMPAQA
jgi:uncharacterized protein